MDLTGHHISRRKLLSLGLAGGVLATVSARFGANSIQDLQVAQEKTTSAQYALIIDTTVCTGCGACTKACNIKNNLPEGQSYIYPLVQGDNHKQWFLMVQCQQCAVLYCNDSCPTDATYIRDDGVVIINDKLCIGCKACIYSCPYQARIFNEERGVVEKCWLCLDLVLGGGLPACVQACVPGARIFGRTDDPDSQVSKLIASGRAQPLRPEFGTEPAILQYIIEE